MLSTYEHGFALFFTLINPFLMSIYMIGMIRNSEAKVFNKALIQGSLIAFLVFIFLLGVAKRFLIIYSTYALNPFKYSVESFF